MHLHFGEYLLIERLINPVFSGRAIRYVSSLYLVGLMSWASRLSHKSTGNTRSVFKRSALEVDEQEVNVI